MPLEKKIMLFLWKKKYIWILKDCINYLKRLSLLKKFHKQPIEAYFIVFTEFKRLICVCNKKLLYFADL